MDGGSDNAVLVDAVTMDNTLVSNGSFETPVLSGAEFERYNPTGASWTFVGSAGVARPGGELLDSSTLVPLGNQVAFVQGGDGVIEQTVTLSAGAHTLAFSAAQGAENKMPSRVRVMIGRAGYSPFMQRFVWNGTKIAEERDSSGAVVKKRFFAEGEQRWNEKLDTMESFYYTRDHLGSIREVTDASGSLQARYDYDVWGNSAVLEGDLSLDFGFTGHYFHASSGLNLTLYRAYSPTLGKWLSRDPIGEAGGINLYGYVLNNPTNWIDPLGLDVFVGEHPGVINNSYNPLNHAAIVLRPNNPADFANNPLFAATGGREATLGGQAFGGPWSAFIGSLYGNLRSAPNYPADAPANLNNITPVSCPSGKSDTQFINDLIRAANGYRNDQPYNPFGLNGTYNSNSYVSGVLTAAGAVPPVFGGTKPAYNTPLPIPGR